MMPSGGEARPVELANYVVSEIRAAKFDANLEERQVERVYLPTAELGERDTGALKVLVAISGWRMAPDNRAEWEYQIDIDVGVLFRRTTTNVGPDAVRDYDSGMRLAEQIADLYRFKRAGVHQDFRIEGVQFGAGGGQPYIPELIQQFNQFASVVRLTFIQLRGE